MAPQHQRYPRTRRTPLIKRITVATRDTWLLLREFRAVLFAFIVTLWVSATTFRLLWNLTPGLEHISVIDAVYFIVTMILFEPTLSFPDEWYLEVYFFIMPIFGVIFLTLGVADFAVALFDRRTRFREWELSVASTFVDHIILIGLGHVGMRVLRELVSLGEDVTVIELKEKEENFAEARRLNVPVIHADGRSEDALNQAGLMRAQAVIICTDNDLYNIQIASRIRERTKTVRIVMRLYDDDFGPIMGERFGIDAVISSSALSAPAFAGAATGTEVIHTFTVEDRVLAMGRIEVRPGTKIIGKSIEAVERKFNLNVVMVHMIDGEIDISPEPDYLIRAGDVLAVVSDMESVFDVNDWNRTNSGLIDPGSKKSWWKI